MNKAFAKPLSRRAFLVAGGGFAGVGALPGISRAADPKPNKNSSFSFDALERRAGLAAAAAFEAPQQNIPIALKALSQKQWRAIRFRAAKALRAATGSPYKLELFQRGGPWQQAMTINTTRNGIATPVPYLAEMFDFGAVAKPAHLPVNFGFAGFRLMGPLQAPVHLDEMMQCLGGGRFRFFGRHQVPGSACQALADNIDGVPSAAPFFREVWFSASDADADHITMLALLDGPSATGAFEFKLYPGANSTMLVTATLFARKAGAKFGLAGLSSLFMTGENDSRVRDAIHPELHQADGLLIHGASGEFLWRPLHNPAEQLVSSFAATGLKGFGLMQRDRHFSHYQSIAKAYQSCPSYWIEPLEGFAAGHIELVETPAPEASHANIFASFVPDADVLPGQALRLRYRITATLNQPHVSPGGRAVNSFIINLPPSPREPGKILRRVMVDFAGDDLAWFVQDAAAIKVDASAAGATILHASGTINPAIKGYRATVDLALPWGGRVDVRIFLKAADRTLTETWTFPLEGQS